MKWFGPTWNAPICVPEEHCDTPVGKACCHCGELIIEDDRGIMMPTIENGASHDEPMHVPCFMRGIIGSVGHQQKKCSCYGGTEEDPPGVTKRQAALLAYQEFKRSNLDAREHSS